LKANSIDVELQALRTAVAGRYSIERELGRGGMGVVYLARDVALERVVAIKVLPPHLSIVPRLRERFIREARTAARLSHPNIVPIYSVEATDRFVYFVMAFVPGETLAERIARFGPLEPGPAVKLVQEAAWALAYAHRQGVVHRDVKPDNILLEDLSGRAMLTDFGIAKLMEGTSVTATGEIVGTARYMSPEQAGGDPIDGRSDLYSLGVTAYFALTGRAPFEAPNPAALLVAHLQELPPPLATVRPELPERLAAVVDQCLAKSPAARFATGEELAEAVGEARPRGLEVPESIRRLQVEIESLVGDSGGMVLLGGLVFLAEAAPISSGIGGEWGAMFDSVARAVLLLAILIVWVIRASAIVWHARALLNDGYRATEVAGAAWIASPDRPKRAGWPTYAISILVLAAGWWFRPSLDQAWRDSLMLDLVLVGGALIVGKLAIGRLLGAGRRQWIARVGRKFTKAALWLGGIGLVRGRGRMAGTADATEVLLHHAATGLFDALPKGVRGQVPDLPRLVAKLDAAAQALRAREAQLASAVAQAGKAAGPGLESAVAARRSQLVAEMDGERRRIRARLVSTIATLENIRIGLLRLSAGLGTPSDLTPDLEAARQIGEHIDALLAGHAEVEQLLGVESLDGRKSE
jgi:eukaryotic-like serine/threonine-protein kinase